MRNFRRMLTLLLFALAPAPWLAAEESDSDPSRSSVAEAPARSSPRDIAREVDRRLAADLGHTPASSASADDYTFLRRATLDLIGYLPTPEEITRFVLNPSADKRAHAIDRLLADERYGENWARYWRDVILYRRSDDRGLLSADAVTDYLSAQLNENQSWDTIARSFITAEGDVRENGATAVIMAQLGRPEDTVAELSRIFLGIQIQCAQCHDHPFDRWEREQFHQLAAFFPRVAVRPRRAGNQRSFQVYASDTPPRRRPNNNNRYRGSPEHRMPDLDDPAAPGTLVQPTFFVSGAQLPVGTPDAERRGTLATWMTSSENPWFAKALVNRMWSELIGTGFYEPVDDMGPDRDGQAEGALDVLASAFVASGYDLKWLVRTIMLTDAYQRPSQSRSEGGPADLLASHPQRLRADQLYNAVATALFFDPEARLRMAGSANLPRRGGRADPRRFFAAIFGYDPSEPRTDINGSVPQALLLMNSELLERLLSSTRRDGLGGLLADIEDDKDLVHELYLRCLSRLPTKAETAKALRHVRKSPGRGEAFEDLLWALINSSEFIHRS